jgi:hypothetical protein
MDDRFLPVNVLSGRDQVLFVAVRHLWLNLDDTGSTLGDADRAVHAGHVTSRLDTLPEERGVSCG